MTAVEWLMRKLEFVGIKDLDLCDDIYLQAKQVERQQIIDAHLIGLITSLETEATKQATEYYNETYGK